MVALINKATRRLDSWSYRYPARTALVMAALGLVVIAVANSSFARGGL